MDGDLSERRLTHFVGGAWRAPLSQRMAGGRRGRRVLAGPEDLARALAVADAAAPEWHALPPGIRAGLLAEAGLAVAETPAFPATAPLLRFTLPQPAKLGVLLASGRVLVLVSPRATPRAMLGLIEALRSAGLPPGVLNLLNGHAADLAQTASAPAQQMSPLAKPKT
ncbi:aldehyde dehydrogenase family protein [Frigidibacter albus]|uniref:Aldehyde dehydrogenase family protein n=1 Tax=Frigidibacter albus TaxID=1465486 RepID=A0A6L8VJL2_9RHOB|nr:aldehyde dehydrogenase family protein [Frigidibacter albus]MZQ89886.1 aldehyde dehydrogenase family protein [Frigidibacter albus]NBE31739.1 aldehyde dehydrogenase family protein [Frigidibacter albus]GGH56159.1 hypothetical protein GCM10011341_24360 [Frigidibacter albus]